MNTGLLILGLPLLGWGIAITARTTSVGWTDKNYGLILSGLSTMLGGVVVSRLSHDIGSGIFWGSLLTVISGLAVWKFIAIPRASRAALKGGSETNRQAWLHSILLGASLLFLMPFFWMLSTSLKEEEDMSRFPPVWIPLQQSTIDINGKPLGLALADYNGERVKVAVLKEHEDGMRELRILPPSSKAGKEFRLTRSKVEKIKHIAPVWKNYGDALRFLPEETMYGLVFLWNTVFLTAMVIFGTLLSSSMVAFAFSRLRWPGRDPLFIVMLATMMVPKAVTMMPIFLIFRQLGWIDTLRPLWVPSFFGSALYIFLLRQFFMTIPNDLEEAARIDGCSYFGIFWRIMFPLIKPALAAITVLSFMATWNDFMNPLIYVSTATRMPVSYALALFHTAHGSEPGMLMAAATMMMLPVLAIFFFTQRYFIQGVTLTGIKG